MSQQDRDDVGPAAESLRVKRDMGLEGRLASGSPLEERKEGQLSRAGRVLLEAFLLWLSREKVPPAAVCDSTGLLGKGGVLSLLPSS